MLSSIQEIPKDKVPERYLSQAHSAHVFFFVCVFVFLGYGLLLTLGEQDDFYHWVDVMDKFDDVLAAGNRTPPADQMSGPVETQPLVIYEAAGAQAQVGP